MGHFSRNSKFLAAGLALAVMAIVGGALFATSKLVTAEKSDWPSLNMRYNEARTINNQLINESYLLTYNSYSDWKEEVTSGDPIETGMGTFSLVGSYKQLQGRTFTTYDSMMDSTETETIPEGVTMVPRLALTPTKISVVEDAYDQRAESVTASARVCFQDTCTENAPGWQLVLEGTTVVFANDARGIPIQVGNFFVDEILVGAPAEEYAVRSE